MIGDVISTSLGELIEQLSSDRKSFLLCFSSSLCAVCQAVYPRLRDLAAVYGVILVGVDIVQEPAVAAQALVFTVPTVLVMHEGREALRESRFIDFDSIERSLMLLAERSAGLSGMTSG